MRAVISILVLCSECLAIRVPLKWDENSAVQHDNVPLEDLQPSEKSSAYQEKPIPVEYFEYTAKKPQFAVDIAKFHGVQNPQEHYKAYPVKPYTGVQKPQFGKHKILNKERPVFDKFQQFAQINEPVPAFASATKSNYEVFHPYKEEEPALQTIYKDPILSKIRDDIRSSQTRLQKYENEAGKPNIQDDEYLESPEQTDRNKFPHRNIPVQFEVHRPQRRPVYYVAPAKYSREHILNHKFRHPWNQYNAKIRPLHYRPLKTHIHRLRQHHAMKYDDERNEYPQPPPHEAFSEPADGYDIFERGKEKYVQLRNNVDESINKAIKENRPTIYQKLELTDNGDRTETQINDENQDESELLPVKSYAQVRKTETTKHLPREAAFADAESFDEILNAPRLREAIKSTKAQTVYTEEGYEDAAYDHAGEQKHAAEAEAHGGYLKEKELSLGKYKIPSVAVKYEDANGNEYRDQLIHGEKWKNDKKDSEQENDSEDFSEDETADYIEADVYKDVNGERNKRENESKENLEPKEELKESKTKRLKENDSSLYENGNEDESDTSDEPENHEVNKRETNDKQNPSVTSNFKIPDINFNSTFYTPEELLKTAKLQIKPKKEDIKEKYPYYFKKLKMIHKDSPLRYAENLKFIPKKSNGGTEFYDSRSKFECPEVNDKVDAIPQKLKKDGHPDEANSDEDEEDNPKKKGEANFDHIKEKPRLKGLGDKIDCFKAKYFGENPLDSPFFKEEIISNPEPMIVPNLKTYQLIPKELSVQETQLQNILQASDKLNGESQSDTFTLLEQLRNGQRNLQESLVKTNQELKSSLIPQNFSIIGNIPTQVSQQFGVYTDILDNIKNSLQKSIPLSASNSNIVNKFLDNSDHSLEHKLGNYKSHNLTGNKENLQQTSPIRSRKKRATPFVYEPYKIIRQVHVPESKKTTTTNNISPLIKHLQSSRIIDNVPTVDETQLVKRNVGTRVYKDIGKQDRGKQNKGARPIEPSFVDVSEDGRRGEPRYEIRPSNHKLQYTPVENKKAISREDYEAKTNKTENKVQINSTVKPKTQTKIRLQTRRSTVSPYYDVASFLPKSHEMQTPSATNTVKKVIKNTHIPETSKKQPTFSSQTKVSDKNKKNEDDYEEYDDDEEEEEITTTTTTLKPHFKRRRPASTTTTPKSQDEEVVQEYPRLRLITRFRSTTENSEQLITTEKPILTKYDDNLKTSPQYREKKRKSTKSTLVTDTKSYGDEDDDMMKEEVDAMIGVQHDMDEYTPMYEKEQREKASRIEDDDDDENDEDGDDDDDDDEDDSEEEEDEEFEDENNDKESEEEKGESKLEVTTSLPTKRTLVRTTEPSSVTTEPLSAKLELKPIVMKKKIEIHKEIPVNKSSPHVTQFKQDIKEVEVIKEIPSKGTQRTRKPQKNVKALELYKDENLAKEVNKLDAVEIFKANLDLRNGPKHGGNYRSVPLEQLREETSTTSPPLRHGELKIHVKDAEASQSEDMKAIELTDMLPARRLHGGNLKSFNDFNKRSRNNNKNAKLELLEPAERLSPRNMHGGNLKSSPDTDRRRNGSRSEKLIELDEDRDEDDDHDSTSSMHGGNFKSYGNSRSSGRRLHGGNYRSSKIVQADNVNDESSKEEKKVQATAKNARTNAAVLLNSFAQAVPILTTTPAYILDPSKRMYYYVEP